MQFKLYSAKLANVHVQITFSFGLSEAVVSVMQ